MGDPGEVETKPDQSRSLLGNCIALREEIARVIQKSREARWLFKKRHIIAAPTEPVKKPAHKAPENAVENSEP